MSSYPSSIIDVGRDELGAAAQDLQAQIDSGAAQTTLAVIGVDVPIIDLTTPPVFSDAKKGKVYVYFRFTQYGSAVDLKVVFVQRNQINNATDYDVNRFTGKLGDKIPAGTTFWTSRVDALLEPNTQYDVIGLVAIGADGVDRARNPTPDPVYAAAGSDPGYPANVLTTFTTPVPFGAPSGPDASLITFNERDLMTADQHDAHVGLKIYCPLDAGGGAQSYGTAGIDWVRAVLERDYGAAGVQQDDIGAHLLTDTELTQVDAGSTPANRGYVVLDEVGLKAGATYTWKSNIVHAVGGTNKATGSVAIIAANEQGDLTQLLNTALTVVATDPFDGKHVQPRFEFTQPALIVSIKNYTLKLKKAADTDWGIVGPPRQNSIQSDGYHTLLNAGTISGTTGSLVVTGVGTTFTKLEAGWKMKVGAQTLIISDTPTSDTSLNVTVLPVSNFTTQAYTIVSVVALVPSMKVKPSTSYNLQLLVRARSSVTSPLVLSLNFATDADGNVIVDTQVPGGTGATLTAPVVTFEDGKMAIDFSVTGLTFMNTHLYNSVRLATLSETVPTFTITNAPLTTSPTTITTSTPHGYSVGQTPTIAGVGGNTAVNGPQTIVTVPSTTTFRIDVAGNFAYTSGGTVALPGAFLDIPSKALVASGTTSKYQVHKSGHVILGFKLRKIRDILGPTAHMAVRYFIANSVGETQSAIADVNLASLTDLMSETGVESGVGVPAKTLAINTINVCPGGAFIASRTAYSGVAGSENVVGNEWRDGPGRAGTTLIDTTGSKGLKWVKLTHWIEIATNVFTLGGELSCWIPIKPILPGDTWAHGISLKTVSGTYILNAFTMSLWDEANTADIPGTPTTISALDDRPIILTTSYKVVGAVFQVDPSYVPGTTAGKRRQWLRLKFGENPPVVLHADNEMLNRGSQILPWGPALEDAGIQSDIDPRAIRVQVVRARVVVEETGVAAAHRAKAYCQAGEGN